MPVLDSNVTIVTASCDTWLAAALGPMTNFRGCQWCWADSRPPSHHYMCSGANKMHLLLAVCDHLSITSLPIQQHRICNEPLSSRHLRLVSSREATGDQQCQSVEFSEMRYAYADQLVRRRCISGPNIYTANLCLGISLLLCFQVLNWCCCIYSEQIPTLPK